jgi:hypothetical protein
MKIVALVILTGLASANAYASHEYDTVCDSCVPFGKAQPAVLAAAVTTAESNSAVVGDTIGVCHDFGTSSSEVIYYEVTTAPVTDSADLTFLEAPIFGEDDCADLGIE